MPDQAARLHSWLWLMGQKNHRTALARRAHRKVHIRRPTLTGRWATMRAPYRGGEHPSAPELLHALLGVQPAYAEELLAGRHPLPSHHARRLARDLRSTLGEALTLADELERYADQRERAMGKHVPRRPRDAPTE